MAYANKGQRQAVLAVINTIFVQDGPEAARAQWRLVSDQLREKFPKLHDLFVDDATSAPFPW